MDRLEECWEILLKYYVTKYNFIYDVSYLCKVDGYTIPNLFLTQK